MKLLTYKDSSSEYTYYLDSNGDTIVHGEYKEWYENGKNGGQKHLRDDGLLWENCYYINGKLHGEYKYWYENGQLGIHCFHFDGVRHGERKSWRENGLIQSHHFFIHGTLIPVVEFKSEEEKLLFRIQHPDFRFIEGS